MWHAAPMLLLNSRIDQAIKSSDKNLWNLIYC
jgi:hypothetical protein